MDEPKRPNLKESTNEFSDLQQGERYFFGQHPASNQSPNESSSIVQPPSSIISPRVAV